MMTPSARADPMGPLDALFLHAEDGINHMHIASCAIFAGPAPSIDEMTRLIESKLPALTRYRQRVQFVLGGLGHPVWVDDPHFSLRSHVHHVTLSPPGSLRDLERLMGELMSSELDRRRPLWDAWLVQGLTRGRWALISKVHHCMVDGIAGTGLMTVLLDLDPDAPLAPIQPWLPVPAPSSVALAAGALARLAAAPVRGALALRTAGLGSRRRGDRLGDVVTGLRSLGERLAAPSPALSIEGAIGPRRRWAAARCTLADVRTIRNEFGGSVNDVVLAAISGAFRTLLVERGDAIDETVVLRSLVPVSVRHPGDATSNNQVSLIVAELPVGIADPVERLHRMCAQMTELKASHQSDAGEAVEAAGEFLPPVMLSLGTRAVVAMLHRVPQRFINTVTTNVPGPQFPLYALGREMLEYLPFVPIAEGVRIGVAIMSYNGRITFGVTGDDGTAPDVHRMAERIEAEIVNLRDRARRRQHRGGESS
ncbi:unannotated protein [freshwater metagenome]|uniref:diacylglycerol O-acyltransferase n=1 Tax=freshwater metagenome TaxID=449393 RepID=A0A6J7CT66_9ZZZZ